MRMRSLRIFALLSLGLTGSACNWNAFDDIAETASVRVFEAPGSYNKSNYGAVLATVRRVTTGLDSTHFLASGGSDSPVVIEGVWENNGLGGGSALLCRDKKKCPKAGSVGAALIPFEAWATASDTAKYGCALSPGVPNAFVFCASAASGSENFPFKLDTVAEQKATFRFAGAGLPPKFPLGVALIGVYSRLNSNGTPVKGALFYQPDRTDRLNVPENVRLDFIDPRTKQPFSTRDADAGDYGYQVAAYPSSAQSVLIAVSQPAKNRVIVARYDHSITPPAEVDTPEAQATYRSQTLACVKSPDASLIGFGKVMTLGDVDGDGAPELFVGIDPSDLKNGTKQRLYMYPGTGLPAFDADADTCPLWDEEPVQVGCIGGIRGVDCADTAFGASIAVGDVDGDSYGDLIVGAPLADVQGEKDAGVLWVIPGSDTGLDLEAMTNLYAAGQKSGGRLGASVAALRTRNRDEPVGGAPGADRVYVFMCSELESESTKSYCLPKN